MNRTLSRLAVLALIALPVVSSAQDRSALLLPVPKGLAMGGTTGRAQPGVAAASPLGFGPAYRDVFVGFGYQSETRYGGDDDGSLSIGMGLGAPSSSIGVELVVTSLSTVRSGFGDRMVGSIKLHRNLGNGYGLGVGVEGFKLAGDNFETDESVYLAISRSMNLGSGPYFNGLTLNLGVGNGRFLSEDDFVAGEDGVNAFASAGLRITSWLGAIGDWTGQDLVLGASIAPFPKLGLVITPAIADVTGAAGDAARFTLGAGLSWRF